MVELHRGDVESLRVFYDVIGEQLFIERPQSNIGNYPTLFSVPLASVDGRIQLHILLDESSVEVFANDGTHVMTAQTFISPSSAGMSVFSHQGETVLTEMTVRKINSIWQDQELEQFDFCE